MDFSKTKKFASRVLQTKYGPLSVVGTLFVLLIAALYFLEAAMGVLDWLFGDQGFIYTLYFPLILVVCACVFIYLAFQQAIKDFEKTEEAFINRLKETLDKRDQSFFNPTQELIKDSSYSTNETLNTYISAYMNIKIREELDQDLSNLEKNYSEACAIYRDAKENIPLPTKLESEISSYRANQLKIYRKLDDCGFVDQEMKFDRLLLKHKELANRENGDYWPNEVIEEYKQGMRDIYIEHKAFLSVISGPHRALLEAIAKNPLKSRNRR